jgi:hypothetical protein
VEGGGRGGANATRVEPTLERLERPERQRLKGRERADGPWRLRVASAVGEWWRPDASAEAPSDSPGDVADRKTRTLLTMLGLDSASGLRRAYFARSGPRQLSVGRRRSRGIRWGLPRAVARAPGPRPTVVSATTRQGGRGMGSPLRDGRSGGAGVGDGDGAGGHAHLRAPTRPRSGRRCRYHR